MKNIIYIITALLIISLTSCEELLTTVREIDIPEHEQKLSVNAILTKDSLTAFISHSKAIDDETKYSTIDAKVSLLKNGNEILNFDYNNGNNPELVITKKLDNPIEEGVEYTIIVDSKSFGTAKSSEIAPKTSKIESLDFDEATIEGEYEQYNKFNFVIDDEKGIDNYYIIDFRVEGLDDGRYNYISASTKDPQISRLYIRSDLNSNYYYESSFLISDSNFAGVKRKLSFELTKPYIDSQSIEYKIILKVSDVSKSYYNYLISREQAADSEENPFAEPVSIVDNIENGYGIFNVYSSTKYVIYEK